MIQLEQQQQREFVGEWCGGWWLTPTNYIQLAGAGLKLVEKVNQGWGRKVEKKFSNNIS